MKDTRRWALLPVAGMVLLGLLAWGTRPTLLFDGTGEYGTVQVVERWNGLRELYTGGGRARQTALYPDRPGELEITYTRVAMAGVALVPGDARILFVGLGGGAMPRFVHHHRPAARIQVVELDPLVAEVAREWFAFPGPDEIPVQVADGRAYLEASEPGAWDLVVLDAYDDNEVPRSLTTRNFLEEVQRVLAPGGIVASNVPTSSPSYLSMLTTYQAVFPQVVTVGVPGRRQRILLAADTLPQLTLEGVEAAARALAREVPLGFDLASLVRRDFLPVPEDLQAPVLEDPGGPR